MFNILEHEPVRKMLIENAINLLKVIVVMGIAFGPLFYYIWSHP